MVIWEEGEGMMQSIRCEACGVVVVNAWRGRPRRFCSGRCRVAAFRRSRRLVRDGGVKKTVVEVVREKYGPDFYARCGREGARVLTERRGREHYVQLGREGGEALKRERGSAWFAELGRRGDPALKSGRVSKRNRNPTKAGVNE